MDIRDYVLNVPKLDLNGEGCRIEIKKCLTEIIDLAAMLPDRTLLDFDSNPHQDLCGEAFDRLKEKPSFKAFTDLELVDFSKVRGKQIYQAIKLTMMHGLLSGTHPQIDWIAFENYLEMIMNNYVKLITAQSPISEVEQIEQKIYQALVRKGKDYLSLRELSRKSYRIDGKRLNTYEIRDIILGLQDREFVKVEEGAKGTMVFKWTGKTYHREA